MRYTISKEQMQSDRITISSDIIQKHGINPCAARNLLQGRLYQNRKKDTGSVWSFPSKYDSILEYIGVYKRPPLFSRDIAPAIRSFIKTKYGSSCTMPLSEEEHDIIVRLFRHEQPTVA